MPDVYHHTIPYIRPEKQDVLDNRSSRSYHIDIVVLWNRSGLKYQIYYKIGPAGSIRSIKLYY